MVEAYAWGQAWQWGYFKHPPLMAWIAGAWFALMPTTHASYALLASVTTAVGLAGFALLCREFLPRSWWALTVAAAMLTPGATTMAMRFNANAVLVAVWPWAIAFFVRYMHRGRIGDALACALAAALAMLGKYYSVVLLASLLLAALAHPPWRARLRSRGAALALAAFALLLVPHALWLAANDYAPLTYMRHATEVAHEHPLVRAVHFVWAQLLFPVFGFGLVAAAVAGRGHGRAIALALRDLLRPSTDPTWLLALLPIAVTAIGTVATGARTSVVWGLPISMGLVLWWSHRLCGLGLTPRLRPAALVLALLWAIVIVLAPLSWWLAAREHAATAAEPRAELARAVAAGWSQRFRSPLRWVSGSTVIAEAVTFYAEPHPRYWSAADTRRQTPWVDPAVVRAQGSAIVCDLDDRACRTLGAAAGSEQLLSVAKRSRGFDFAPRTFAVYWMAPSAQQPAM